MEQISKLIEKYGGEVHNKLRDPIFFINEIVGFEGQGVLTTYQEEWVNLVENYDRLNLMCFRSGGKTETLLINYPIFKAFTQAGWQGILVSNSLKQSVSILRRLRDKILSSEVLRTSIPGGKGALWSKTEIGLKNGSMIWSRPNNENLPGEHVDFVGLDEIGYWKDMDIITKVIPPMTLAKKGKVVAIGTTTSLIDPIHQLMKNPSYISKAYPANLRDPTSGRPLIEVRYPLRKIEDIRKEYDSMSWSREFLLKPLGNKDRIYPYELISKCLDPEASFSLIKKGDHQYIIGLDFALSGETGADYTVYTVLEGKEGKYRLINIERYRGLSYQAQKLRIKNLYDIYQAGKVIADENSFGKSFIADLRQEGVPMEGFFFTNKSKQDLHTNLRNMFERNVLMLNYDESDPKTKNMVDMLIKELSSFGVTYDQEKQMVKFEGLGEHDDMVTSLALACWACKGQWLMTWHIERGLIPKSNVFSLGSVN